MNDILISLSRVFIGSIFGISFGILLASIRYSIPARAQSNPVTVFLFEFMRFPPPIAWLPFVILILGISPIAPLLIVFLAVFPTVQTNVYDGLIQVPLVIKRMANTLELSSFEKIKKIYIPMILPQFFTSIRLGLGMGWMSIIAAEMIGGQEGLGYSIQLHRIYLQTNEMIKDIFWIGVIGFAMHFLIKKAEKRLAPWANRNGDAL